MFIHEEKVYAFSLIYVWAAFEQQGQHLYKAEQIEFPMATDAQKRTSRS